MINICTLKIRKCDQHGCGHYGASRGPRVHVGVDLCADPGTEVKLGFSGTVVKVGWAYPNPDRSHIRYISVKLGKDYQKICGELYGKGEYHCRIFYIDPNVSAGYCVNEGSVVGRSQRLGGFFEGITEHIHFELYRLKDDAKSPHKKINFGYVDPNDFLSYLRGDAK